MTYNPDDIEIPDTIADIPEPANVVDSEPDEINAAIELIGSRLAAPAALFVITPTPGNPLEPDVRMRLDARAYADITHLADTLDGIAETLRRNQGEINADSYRRRNEEDS